MTLERRDWLTVGALSAALGGLAALRIGLSSSGREDGLPAQPVIQNPPGLSDRQGPSWLVEWIATPPDWVLPIYAAIFAATVAIVAFVLYRRDWQITRDQEREIHAILLPVSCMFTTTVVATALSPLGYLGDVSIGVASGYLLLRLVQHPRLQALVWGDLEASKRRTMSWIMIAAIIVMVPMGLPPIYRLSYAATRGIIASVAVALALWNAPDFDAFGPKMDDVDVAGD